MKYNKRRTEMYTERIDITPAMAFEAIENDKTVHHNRPLRDFIVTKYANDMKDQRWDNNHQGYAFGPDGEILDGQHRLWAQAEAGVTLSVLCTFNMPPENQKSIDDHAKRTVRDVAAIMMNDGRVLNLHSAIANRMRFGSAHVQTRGISRQETLSFMVAHFESIDFAVRMVGTKTLPGVTRASVLAPVARAWFTQDRPRLAAFIKILMSGHVDDHTKDRMAVQLREYLVRSVYKAARPKDEMIYNKTERALLAFLKGEQTLKLYEAQTELFPIPFDTSKKPLPQASTARAKRLSPLIERNREFLEQQETKA